MTHLETLRTRRKEILKELAMLEQMRRGSVVEQFVETVKKDGTKTRRGPYALYSYKEKKKTVSRRLTDPKLAGFYRKQIQAFRRFQELASELTSLSEKISDTVVSDEEGKKTPKSSSSRTGK